MRRFSAKKIYLHALLIFLIFLSGVLLGYCKNHIFSEDARFERFSEDIFRQEISSNTLNLHYSLADPSKYHIPSTRATLGKIPVDSSDYIQKCTNTLKQLKEFTYSKLSPNNKIDLDTLLLYYNTQLLLKDCWLLEEPLSPVLGIQAQLPVLLAEYAFRKKSDITDYLNLLCSVDAYFDSILRFEQKKSEAGLFMSDASLQRILDQCQKFLHNPEENFLQKRFQERLQAMPALSNSEQQLLLSTHKKILENHLFPAYQKLMAGLSALRGSGKNTLGLSGFPNGKKYYQYLLQSQVGSYVSVPSIERHLAAQLSSDCHELSLLLQKDPSLTIALTKEDAFQAQTPEDTLVTLQKEMQADFPELSIPEYEVLTVPSSLAEYASPAFYLSPPIDTMTPNIIYINKTSSGTSFDLFTTLAHEGFPGHLYQAAFFRQNSPSLIRSLLSCGGYVEGWATYIEAFACGYAKSFLKYANPSAYARAKLLNRRSNLCLYSLLDIGIHYHGWTLTQTMAFLKSFGISDSAVIEEIFQYIIETPANYLKYCWGYLSILQLRQKQQKQLGESFDLKEFHRQILTTGPVPFPILEKYFHRKP